MIGNTGQKRGPGQLSASEFVTRYNESELGVSNAEMCSTLCLPFEGAVSPDHPDSPKFRTSFLTQFLTLHRRATRELIRTPSYTMLRFAMAGFIPLCRHRSTRNLAHPISQKRGKITRGRTQEWSLNRRGVRLAPQAWPA